jgi:predicted N-acetyltransferase YhbS
MRWHQRMRLPLTTDPNGSFVAERDGQLVGVAQAVVRERVWCLSTLAVEPGRQSAGAGRALLDATLGYGDRNAPGLIMASTDPRALRLYALAGFSLRPALEAAGVPDRRALPTAQKGVREAQVGDLERLAEVSRTLRGGPHTAELEHAMRLGDLVLCIEDRGFAVVRHGHGPWLLAARDEDAARALLQASLAEEAPTVTLRWLSGQDWAVEEALRVGLELRPFGAVAVRGNPGPLRPYLPSGAYC